MSDISMIGLGAMSTALAKAQVNAGHDVTVWNRSPQRMTPLVELGAKGAESVAAAVKASPLIMVCIDNYTATNALLRTDDVVVHLSGRSVIQLSTGTPSEARDSEAWLQARGARPTSMALSIPTRMASARQMLRSCSPDRRRSSKLPRHFLNAWVAIFASLARRLAPRRPSTWRIFPGPLAGMSASPMVHASARWKASAWISLPTATPKATG